ncbi:putative sulfate exporter family transporter [Acetobacter pomorum]|uniref:Putative sulfate exporter family transporter n=1 Tax=Acetobacter pomorum TaxID=65959 RepID=A0A2G4RDJ4_9PROT|nr:putative sulfate exporter family transporter [Acetobacter pomorum]PHY94636.1 putative sulfate exporter family transporter [Acetobacter pomorum]
MKRISLTFCTEREMTMLTTSQAQPLFRQRIFGVIGHNLPGVLLCLALTGIAYLCEQIEGLLCGKIWLEQLNLALIAGVVARTVHKPDHLWQPGIRTCSKTLLNIGIVLLGASFSIDTAFSGGPWLLVGVMGLVTFSLIFTSCIGHVVGLPRPQTLLVACGNSICGNSAIMAAAPAIHAKDEDIGATIAFTAAGGLILVVGLSLAAPFLSLDSHVGGALAGLTVYAVPQVGAAASAFGPTAPHIGMLIKLMRVLMLGPVCIVLSMLYARLNRGNVQHASRVPQMVPWYIIGFIIMMSARSMNVMPQAMIEPVSLAANFLTILAMAALGLCIDIRSVFRAGVPLLLTEGFSLIGLVCTSMLLLKIMF